MHNAEHFTLCSFSMLHLHSLTHAWKSDRSSRLSDGNDCQHSTAVVPEINASSTKTAKWLQSQIFIRPAVPETIPFMLPCKNRRLLISEFCCQVCSQGHSDTMAAEWEMTVCSEGCLWLTAYKCLMILWRLKLEVGSTCQVQMEPWEKISDL